MEDGMPKLDMLDQLESGPWPSFVKEIKKNAGQKESAHDLLLQLERSYQDKTCHWKHGGIVGVRGYGGGVIGRYADDPEGLPGIKEFHTLRVNQPSGWFYTADSLRKLADIWDAYGSGLTNFHGATGDIILLGTNTQNLQPCFDALSEEHFDLGGSGSALRTPSCCVGPGYCEHSCLDTLDICQSITRVFQNELHRPAWPYKFKVKISGCGNDCVAAIARSDLAVIGTWKDDLIIDQSSIKAYQQGGMDINEEIVRLCPSRALTWNQATRELEVKNEDCVRCMHCINKMPKAVRPGRQQGATLLVGGKATILRSAFMGWVLVPFMEIKPPYTELTELLGRIFDWWDENAKTRERIGELIYRLGMPRMLRDLGLEPVAQMVRRPRANPYVFWSAEEVNK